MQEQEETIPEPLKSEGDFRNLVSQASVGIAVLEGKEMTVKIANERYCQLIHKPYAAVIGKPIFEVIPEADKQLGFIIDEVLSSGKEKYLYDYPFYIYLNGERQHIYTNHVCQPYKDASGVITGVLILVHDVTEQMRTRREIEYSEERARLAIESAELGVYELDLITNNMITNTRFSAIFGFERKMTKGEYVASMHPDDLIIRRRAYEEARISGNLIYELRLIWKDGSVHWIKATGKIFNNLEGVAVKLLGVIQEITDQKLFAAELEKQVVDRTKDLSKTNRELRKINDELEQYAHVSSHDLQEPVRKIRIYADLIKNRDYHSLSAVSKSYFDKIEKSAEKLSVSLKDLLNFNSIVEENRRQDVDLNALIGSIETDLELIIAEKNAVIRREVLPVINGVVFQFHQLFYNLVNNALKFSKAGVNPEVHLSSRQLTAAEVGAMGDLDPDKLYHQIVIGDNGIGFEQASAEKIFTIFQRLHSKEEYSGTGIGLALCKKVAVNHDGKLWAISSKGNGANFYIVLPEK